MKDKIKKWLAASLFAAYHKRILKNRVHVCSIEETVKTLLDTKKSLVRFGDGEIKLIAGREIPFQKPDAVLTARLKEIISGKEEGLLVALPDIFEDLSAYVSKSQEFWMEHMLFHRKDYERICRKDIVYQNAFFSRPYIMYRDRSGCSELFSKMKEIWNNQKIVFVEGEISHNGVDVDLFDNVISVERVICPSTQAWNYYEKILETCKKLPKDRLLLVSLGAAGKVLTIDLHKEGYRVLDVGSLDMEYGWFCEKAESKCRVPKHEISTREENEAAGYYEYLGQIVSIIR